MRVLVFVVSLLALAGCNSHGGQPGGAPSTAASAVSIVPDTASDVVKALDEAGLRITDVTTLDEKTDSNHMLGRPGQYTSKVMFYDARHPKGGDDDPENTIEVFANDADAIARRDYVAAIEKGAPFLLQYQIFRGRVLIRLHKILLPKEAKEYETALARIIA